MLADDPQQPEKGRVLYGFRSDSAKKLSAWWPEFVARRDSQPQKSVAPEKSLTGAVMAARSNEFSSVLAARPA